MPGMGPVLGVLEKVITLPDAHHGLGKPAQS